MVTPRRFALAVLLFLALNVADVVLTFHALQQGAVELNPFFYILDKNLFFGATKLVFQSVALIGLFALWKLDRKMAWAALMIGIAMYVVTVSNNILQLVF